MHSVPFLTAVLVVACGAGSVVSQSLADVAREEQARRKTITAPSKVYTNEDLRPGRIAPPQTGAPESGSTAGGSSAASSAATVGGEASGPGAGPGDDEAAPAGARDEADWRDRMSAAQQQLERARVLAAAMQSRVNALNADFVNVDDPAQRAIIESDRQKALAEAERLNEEVAELTQAIADIQEEARRAGVPPGWLR
jgi:hypothetical protein